MSCRDREGAGMYGAANSLICERVTTGTASASGRFALRPTRCGRRVGEMPVAGRSDVRIGAGRTVPSAISEAAARLRRTITRFSHSDSAGRLTPSPRADSTRLIR